MSVQNNLASCYTQLRNAPKALEAAQHAVEIAPRGVGPRLNLAFIGAFAGDFDTSEKEARAALEINPSIAQGHLTLAEAQIGQGQIKKAADSYHQLEKFGALGISSAADGLADVAAYQGNYADAAESFKGAADDVAAKMTDNAARKYAALANIDEWQGHQAAALADIGKALALSQSIQIQFLAARVYVEAGDMVKAQKLATLSLPKARVSHRLRQDHQRIDRAQSQRYPRSHRPDLGCKHPARHMDRAL